MILKMDKLINLIKNTFEIDYDIQPNTALISSGIIDSLRVTLLLTVLEREYGKSINTRDVGTDNFDTPLQIEKFLNKV